MQTAYRFPCLQAGEDVDSNSNGSIRSKQLLKKFWLDLLRRQYNYRLSRGISRWKDNRCPVNACLLIMPIPKLRNHPDYYSQKKNLVNTFTRFRQYKLIHSQVLPDCIKQVKLAFDRWFKVDRNGPILGKQRLKGKGRYRSFTYPQIKPDCVEGNKINLPKIGKVKLIKHAPLPDGYGCRIKKVTISHKTDGHYVMSSCWRINQFPP